MDAFDVAVIGCGPVGVMAALRCAQRGLSVVAIDRADEVYPLPRAIGMDEEIQDLFARAGMIDQLRVHSTPLRGAEFVDATGKRVVGIDVPAGTTGPLGHPPTIMFDQPNVERFMRQAALKAGVELRLGIEALALNQGHDGVTVSLTDQGMVHARWVIGADGAKSTVRDLVDISMIDQEFDQTWLVVDTTLLDPALPLPDMTRQHCDPQRVVTYVPGHGTRRRWEFQLKPTETRDQALEASFLTELMAPWGTDAQLQVDRRAVYRFHATVADRFRDRGVFLAGDAAHQMPPFNGQGMCSGMRDAENLAWKLAMVAKGQAGERLLDTFDEERRPHAAAQVVQSADAGRLIEAIAHDGERALDSGYGRRRFPKLVGGVLDGDHPRVGLPWPKPFDGFELGDQWAVLQVAPAAATPSFWKDIDARVYTVDHGGLGRLLQPGETALIRPDRVTAAVTTDLAAATPLLAKHFTA